MDNKIELIITLGINLGRLEKMRTVPLVDLL